MKRSPVTETCSRFKDKLSLSKAYEITHVPKESNTRGDILSKLESTKVESINHYFIQEALEKLDLSIIIVVVTLITRITCYHGSFGSHNILRMELCQHTLTKLA